MRRRVLIITSVVLFGLLGLAALFLPSIASKTLDGRLRGSLAKRKVDAQWKATEVNWRGQVELRDLELNDAKRGVSITLKRVTVTPELGTVLSEEPRITHIEVEGIKVLADAAKLRESLKKGKKPDGGKKPVDPNSRAAKLRRMLLDAPPSISLRDVHVALTYHGLAVADLKTKEAALEAQGAQWSIDANGALEPKLMLLPEQFRKTRPWRAKGALNLRERTGKLTVASSDPKAALLDLMFPGIGMARVGKVEADLELGAEKQLRFAVQDAFVRAGAEENPALVLQAHRVETDVSDPKHPILHMSRGEVALDPTRVKELRSLPERITPALGGLALVKAQLGDQKKEKGAGGMGALLGFGKKGAKASEPKKGKKRRRRRGKDHPPTTLEKLEQLDKKLASVMKLLWRVNVTAEDSAFTLQYRDPEAGLQKFRLVEHLDITAHDGNVQARGAAADGEFTAVAQFLPGQSVPVSGSVLARGVRLEKIPLLAQGRTLPNRGIRGKFGGEADISATLVTPEVGIDSTDAGHRSEVHLDVAVKDGMIDLHGLAEEPLRGLDFDTQVTVRWERGQNRISLRDGVVHHKKLTARYYLAAINLPYRPYFLFKGSIDEADCQDIIDGIPEALRGPYRKMQATGRVSPRVLFRLPLNDPYGLTFKVSGLLDPVATKKRGGHRTYYCKMGQLHADKSAWPDVRFRNPASGLERQATRYLQRPPAGRSRDTIDDVYWLNRPFVRRVEQRYVYGKNTEVNVGPGTDAYVPLRDMPPYVGAAMFLSEQILFRSRRSVSPGLIAQALRINIERGRFVYGGSTVTQQLVKNLFLSRRKTLARKLQEAFIALRIDEVITKERVLELYLNCIEFGPNVYGIGPAAKYYFQKSARDLTPLEAVFLAVLKPSPSYGGHLRRRGYTPLSGHMPERIAVIFDRMLQYEFIKPADKEAARPFVLRWEKGIYKPPVKAAPDPATELLPGAAEPAPPAP